MWNEASQGLLFISKKKNLGDYFPRSLVLNRNAQIWTFPYFCESLKADNLLKLRDNVSVSPSLTLCNTTASVPMATASGAVWLIMFQSKVTHTHWHTQTHTHPLWNTHQLYKLIFVLCKKTKNEDGLSLFCPPCLSDIIFQIKFSPVRKKKHTAVLFYTKLIRVTHDVPEHLSVCVQISIEDASATCRRRLMLVSRWFLVNVFKTVATNVKKKKKKKKQLQPK